MKKVIFSILIIASIVGCKKYEGNESAAQMENKAATDVEISNAANPKVEGKVFKSNALIEMKVADVMKNAQEIEQNAIDLKGFVLNSELNNQTLDSEQVDISAEQIKKMEKIQQTNFIELKVPVNQLREHVKFALGKGIIIDHILINNEEMTFEKYENELKNEQNQSVKISKQIENKVNKVLINDGINYATIAYKLSAEPHVVSTILPQSEIKVYREINLGYELKQSWQDGVYYFKSFIILIFKFLPTILSVLFLYFVIKYVLRRFKNREIKTKS